MSFDRSLKRGLAAIVLPVLLAACGVSETASTAATVAKLKAQEAQLAAQTQAQLQQQLGDAERQARERLESAEAATTPPAGDDKAR